MNHEKIIVINICGVHLALLHSA